MSVGLKINTPHNRDLVVPGITIRLLLVKVLPSEINIPVNLKIPGATTECKMISYTGYST